MKINKDSLKARANNLANELGVSQNIIYDRFFYDAFLSRLVISRYKDKFVLKGGLYLSSLLGINNRSTMDLDFYLKSIAMEKDNIVSIIKEISALDLDDNISFTTIGSEDIRQEDVYGGFRIIILGKLDNIRHQFSIDVATGDPIIPSDRDYDYKCLVTGEVLPLKVYSLESVISEKLETVLSKGIANSRSKDFYDLYIIRKTQIKKVNADTLKQAFEKTREYRSFYIDKEDALSMLEMLKENSLADARWIAYCKNSKYVGNLPFEEVIMAIKEWVEIAL